MTQELVKVVCLSGKSNYVRKSMMGADGVRRMYGFDFRYNSREDVYYLDIKDEGADGAYITRGLKCTPLYDLFLYLKHVSNRPAGFLFVMNLKLEDVTDPGLDDLGTHSFLYQIWDNA